MNHLGVKSDGGTEQHQSSIDLRDIGLDDSAFLDRVQEMDRVGPHAILSGEEILSACRIVENGNPGLERGPGKHAPGFRNALIWRYGLGGSSKRCYPKKHDVIFWYTKGARWHFEPPMVPATSQRMKGKLKKAPDVLDIPAINNMAKERTVSPTQKPLALLELLVRAHTQPEDWVCDPMCGSGTTGVAALRLGRNALLGDIGDAAGAVASARAAEVVPGEAL